MDPRRIDPDYDRLVGLLYQGALEQQPWQSALPALREVLDAQVVSLVLRPPSSDDQGVILNCVRPDQSEPGSAHAGVRCKDSVASMTASTRAGWRNIRRAARTVVIELR